MTARVEVRAYDKHNTLLDVIPRRKGVSWQDQLNGPGNGSVTVHRKDAKILANAGLLTEHNIIKFAVDYGTGFVERSGFRVESYGPTLLASGEVAAELLTVSGPGLISLLKSPVVYPESGILSTSGDSRPFNYASKQGAWYNASDWVQPHQVLYTASTVRGQNTQGWPDPAAYWLWPTDPDTTVADGATAYFRGSFNLAAPAAVRVFATFDNSGELWLDGELLFASDPAQQWTWQQTNTYDVVLSAGTHLLAAKVVNGPAMGGPNPAAFICSVATVNSQGQPQSIVFRTNAGQWLCTSNNVGWRAAQILKTLVTEGQSRGAATFAANLLSLGVTDTTDTAGASWTDIQDVELPIGTQTILDIVPQFAEMGIDIAVGPDLVLRAWVQRGTDKTTGANPVRLIPARNLAAHALSRTADLKTRELVRYGSGWVEVVNAAAETAYGHWESAFQLGSTQATTQAQLIAAAANALAANPVDTYTSQVIPVTGALPYVDFDLGDKVQIVNDSDALIGAWLTALTFTEDDNGILTYVPEFLPG